MLFLFTFFVIYKHLCLNKSLKVGSTQKSHLVTDEPCGRVVRKRNINKIGIWLNILRIYLYVPNNEKIPENF